MFFKRSCCFLSIVVLALIVNHVCLAQQIPGPLNRTHNLLLEKRLNSTDTATFTSFKPTIDLWPNTFCKTKSSADSSRDRTEWNLGLLQHAEIPKSRSLLYRKLKEEHLVIVGAPGFYLTIDPVFNLELGFDGKDTSVHGDTTQLFKNTRGVMIRGSIGKKVSFKSSFYENQAFLPVYLSDFEDRYDVIPGQGRTKRFKGSGFDYAMASGLISMSPAEFLNIQLGTDKNFIGDGYRSLVLSDNAFNYPFVKVTTTLWNLRYTNLFTSFQNLNVELPTSGTTERRFQRKIGSYHHLEISLGHRLNIGLFEGMIWNSSETNREFRKNLKNKCSTNKMWKITKSTEKVRQKRNI